MQPVRNRSRDLTLERLVLQAEHAWPALAQARRIRFLVDSSLAWLWQGMQDRWNAGSSFFRRFRLSGWRRLLNEAASEGLTLMVGGLALMYVMAIPAFQEMDESKIWATGKYSVKFVDLRRQGDRSTRNPPQRCGAADGDSRQPHQGDTGDRGPALLRALRRGCARNVPSGADELQRRRHGARRLDADAAARQEPVPDVGALLDAQNQGVVPVVLARIKLTKSQILKLYFDRAYMGGGAFGVEAAAQLYFGKSVRDVTLAEAAMMAGPVQGADEIQPQRRPAGLARPGKRRAVEHGGGRFLTAGQVHAPG